MRGPFLILSSFAGQSFWHREWCEAFRLNRSPLRVIRDLEMRSRRAFRWAGKYPPGGPADWIADGHVTCNIQCRCDRRMVDVRLDTLPQDQPWSVVGRRLVCKKCGVEVLVHIVPNWHDRIGKAVPFTRHWKT
jgi:hypothetical protein